MNKILLGVLLGAVSGGVRTGFGTALFLRARIRRFGAGICRNNHRIDRKKGPWLAGLILRPFFARKGENRWAGRNRSWPFFLGFSLLPSFVALGVHNYYVPDHQFPEVSWD